MEIFLRAYFFRRQSFYFLPRPHCSVKFLCHPYQLKIPCYLVGQQAQTCWHKARHSPYQIREVRQTCWINAFPGLILPGEKLSKPAWMNPPLHCFYGCQYVTPEAGGSGEVAMVREVPQWKRSFRTLHLSFILTSASIGEPIKEVSNTTAAHQFSTPAMQPARGFWLFCSCTSLNP